jgi:hypothetical protein
VDNPPIWRPRRHHTPDPGRLQAVRTPAARGNSFTVDLGRNRVVASAPRPPGIGGVSGIGTNQGPSS